MANNYPTSITAFRHFLYSQFKLKDLGSLRYFLGIKVAQTAKGIHICQRKYALDVLAYSRTLRCRPLKLPMEQNLHLSKESRIPLSDPTPYYRLIGQLLYLSITLPDLSYNFHILNQFMDCPTDIHLAVAYKVLCYIKVVSGQCLFFSSSSSFALRAYYD